MIQAELDPAVARWLVSAAETIADAAERIEGGDSDIAAGAWLRARGLPAGRAAAALGCAKARLRAREIFAGADALIFTPEALEQASPPAASAWRAQRFAGSPRVVDLCAGAGADSLELARVAASVVAVELAEDRAIIAAHNLRARDLRAAVVVGDALALPVAIAGALVHADPSRRAAGRRLRGLSSYRPPVRALLDAVAGARGACVLVSPGVALDDPDLPGDAEVEFIQIENDLVECALWLGDLRGAGRRSATLLPEGLSVHGDPAADAAVPVGKAGRYLLEPQPALVRAGLHERIGAVEGAARIAARRALLTSDVPSRSPWWRTWEIEADLPLRPARIRAWLRTAEPKPLEIVLYGVTLDVPTFLREIGSPPRGPQGRRLFAVRVDRGARAYVCTRIDLSHGLTG